MNYPGLIEKEDLIPWEEIPVWYWCKNRGVWRGPMKWNSKGHFDFDEWTGSFEYVQAEEIKPVLNPDGGFGPWVKAVLNTSRHVVK
jgi:hypothetical protein